MRVFGMLVIKLRPVLHTMCIAFKKKIRVGPSFYLRFLAAIVQSDYITVESLCHMVDMNRGNGVALGLAVAEKDVQMVALLVRHGANQHHDRMMESCVLLNNIGIFDYFCNIGVPIQDVWLVYACERGHPIIAHRILDHQSKVNMYLGQAIVIATVNQHTEIIEMLEAYCRSS